MNGTVTVTDKGAVRLHTYMAPEDSVNVTTQLIETPARLLAVDAQYALPYAHEAAEYAKGLGKPLDRLLVSHAHPDHYTGSALFGAPSFALAEVRDAIAARGDGQDPLGTPVPATDTVPSQLLGEGTETIDGIALEYHKVSGGEASVSLAVRLPEQRVLIAQDLVYNQIHLFLGERDLDGWEQALNRLAALGDDTVLAGHGAPTDQQGIRQTLDYLTVARQVLAEADSAAAYRSAMLQRFPNHRGAALLDITTSYLFATDQGAPR